MGGNMTRGRIFASATKVANYNPTEIGSKRLTLSPKKKKKNKHTPQSYRAWRGLSQARRQITTVTKVHIGNRILIQVVTTWDEK